MSVLLPARDAGASVDAAVASILAQSMADFELVAVDDGSSDDTRARLEAHAQRDARVRVVARGREGLVPALNAGLAACRAPLVARMDADDWADPERLAIQLSFLASNPDVAVVASRAEARGTDDGPAGQGMERYLAWSNALLTPKAIRDARFIESPLVHPTVVMRRAALEAVGGYRDEDWPEDYDLWLRLLGGGFRLAKVPECLLVWRDHGARATRRDPRYAPERHRALKLHHLLTGPLASRPPVVFWGAGIEGKPFLRALSETGCGPRVVVDIDPRKIGAHGGNIVHGARVIPQGRLGEHIGGDTVVLVAVGVPRARDEIRAVLDGFGLEEGARYFFLC